MSRINFFVIINFVCALFIFSELSYAQLFRRNARPSQSYSTQQYRTQQVPQRQTTPVVEEESEIPQETIFGERLRITEVDVSATINVGPYQDTSGSFNSRASIRPIHISTLQDGTSRVAWSDKTNVLHITTLDAEDQRLQADVLYKGFLRMQDFVALDDGSAILGIIGGSTYLVKLDTEGNTVFKTRLTHLTSNNWHTGRLAWNGTKFAAYFGVHRGGHEGDSLKFVTSEGKLERGGWDWGCSHMLDNRVLFVSEQHYAVCLSDAFPSTGFHLNHKWLKLGMESGNASGGASARIGGMVEFQDSVVMAFSSSTNRRSWDAAMLSFKKDRNLFQAIRDKVQNILRPKKWLTNTRNDKVNVKIANYNEEKLLVSWTNKRTKKVSFKFVDIEGNELTGHQILDVNVDPLGDFKNAANGDIIWAYAWGDMNKLKIMRIQI